MAENVSSNILFHFTNSMDNLKSILKIGIIPHYCLEYTLDPEDITAAAEKFPPRYAIPMVCFCDLPISLIRKHLGEYGPYGIGLDKKWGLKNGVTPVLYTHSTAQTLRPVLHRSIKDTKVNDLKTENDLRLIAAYTKPFLGSAWRNKEVKPGILFYDEREWRYVAVIREDEPLFLDREDYYNIKKRNNLQKRLKKQNTLSISPDFIQYLIVPPDEDEDNIIELYDFIMSLYSRRDAKLVSTAIMTVDRIQKDV
jgi:hypothetical protein